MNEIWIVLSSFPTGIYTFLLGLLLILWLLVIIGGLDIDIFSFDMDIDFDTDSQIPGFAGLLHTLGLSGVPFTIVITLITFISWTITYLFSLYIKPMVGTNILGFILDICILIGSFFVALPITAKAIKPLQKLSAENKAKTKIDFLGHPCKVTSLTVDLEFGQGRIISSNGDEIIVRIRADKSLGFKKGDVVRAIKFNKQENSYEVISDDDFLNNLNQ